VVGDGSWESKVDSHVMGDKGHSVAVEEGSRELDRLWAVQSVAHTT
jgi:hypothetical protein